MCCSAALLPGGGMTQLCPRKRQFLVLRHSLQAAKEICNQSVIRTHGRQGRSMSEPYFVKGNAMRDERGQRNQGLGGSNNARFQAIVVAPAGCCCASRHHSRHLIAKINVGDIGERVGVDPVKRTVPGNIMGGQRGQRRQGRQNGHVDILCIFLRRARFFWL